MTEPEPVRQSIMPRLIGIAAILSVHFFSLLVLILVFCSVVPVYQMFFDHRNLEVPGMVMLTIKLSHACLDYWYLAIVFVMPVDAVIVFVLSSLGAKRSWILSVCCHLWLLAVTLLLFFVILSMALPIRHLADPGFPA